MSCAFCLKKYEPYGSDCAYCKQNPRNKKLVDNFEPCYISLTNEDFEVDSVNLDPDGDWTWNIVADDAYNADVYDLKIYTSSGIILTRKVSVKEGRWFEEQRDIVAKMFKLPKDKIYKD